MITLSPPGSPVFVPDLPPGSLFPKEWVERIRAERIVAVITVDGVAEAIPLAHALLDGGVRVVELACRTPAAFDIIAALSAQVPELVVGAGTLLTPAQVALARQAGAKFGVSPGLSVAVVGAAERIGLPFAPGIQTPTDIQAAIELGCRFLKYFPAESAGGVAHLRSMATPFAHLGLQFLPLGGIDEASASAYLAEPGVAAIGGSWIAPPALIRERAWGAIRQRAVSSRRPVLALTTFE